jgi:WD40 repeat protein
VLRGHKDAVWALRYNRLARRAVTGSVDCSARVWDGYAGADASASAGVDPDAGGGGGGACLAELQCHMEPVMSLDADAGRAVSGDSAGWIFLWDFEAGAADGGTDGDGDGCEGDDGRSGGCEYRALMSHCGPM